MAGDHIESFRASGIYTKQAHVKIPDGTFEEEHAREGFFGRVSHIYHQNQPTNWTNIEGDLKPRALPPIFNSKMAKEVFTELLFNNDVMLSAGFFTEQPVFFQRNADADELIFFHLGDARIETIYGHLEVKKGDYVILPRGTTYKIFPHSSLQLLKIEARSEFEQPTRGIMGPNALYDQTAIRIPDAKLGSESGLSDYKVQIKRNGKLSTVTYPFNPLDAVGWKGSLFPWALSIYDFCPVMSHRYHMPPSAHTTFVAKNFVICSFVARPLEDSNHEVLKVPFFHSNIDYDEVLFYHAGDFFSRDNIDAGAITFHPQGIHHGPHPKAFKNTMTKTETNEFAVMLDTRYPLHSSTWFKEQENRDYWKSWMHK